MEKTLDQQIEAWLNSVTSALLLFQDNTLVGLSSYAQKLLPGLEPGAAMETLMGQEAFAEPEHYPEGAMLIPVEYMGLGYDGKLSQFQGYHCLELVITEEAMSASAFQSMAEGLTGPLATVMALMPKLLPQLEETPKNMERAAQVNQGLYAINRALNNIRFSAEEQQLSPHLRHINLTRWLRELTVQLEDLFEMSQRELKVELPEKDLMCDVDLKLLQRALMNVISNAMKYTEPGGHVRLTLGRNGSRIRITVWDDGCGIPAYQIGNVFRQKEYREPVHDPRQGIGLGLGLARKILQVHGGNLLLESQEGQGTAVHLTLPVSQDKNVLPLATAVLRPDYGGGFNKLLLELSDALPSSAFDTRGIDL